MDKRDPRLSASIRGYDSDELPGKICGLDELRRAVESPPRCVRIKPTELTLLP